jgi:YHS domain-containing protein
MKARLIMTSMVVGLLLAVGGLTAAENESAEKEFAATCPVSGRPAIEDSVVDSKNVKVYFCCKNCPKAFQADPGKFALKVARQLIETGQAVQVACSISGRPVNEETMVEVGEAKAGFCCKNCLAKYEGADDEGKLKILFADFKKGFTLQTKCPISGKPINPEASVEYKDEKVYFCCPGCPAAFEAEPEKFVAKLPQFANEDEVFSTASGSN